MIETLKTRKEELEKRGKKGFTLMEMLIVIAIIAVLIAIAIPIFTQQLDKANAATDAANIRSGYAQVQSDIILGNKDGGAKAYLQKDGTVVWGSAGTNTYACKGDSTNAENHEIAGINATWSRGQVVVYTLNASGNRIDTIAGQAAS